MPKKKSPKQAKTSHPNREDQRRVAESSRTALQEQTRNPTQQRPERRNPTYDR